MTFAVVKFTKSNGVSVVPINWIKGDRCFWPPKKISSHIAKFIHRGISASDTWHLYSIKMLGLFSTYEEARLKLGTAEQTSDLNTTDPENRGKGKRPKKRPRNHSSSSSSSSSVFENSNPEINLDDPPVFPSSEVRKNEDENNNTKEYEDDDSFTFSTEKDLVHVPYVVHSESLLDGIDEHTTIDKAKKASSSMSESMLNRFDEHSTTNKKKNAPSSMSSAYNRAMMREMNVLKHNQKSMMESLDIILKWISTHESMPDMEHSSNKFDDVMEIIPLSNINDLNVLEDKLSDRGVTDQMVQYLKRVGGSNWEQSVKFMLRKLITDEMATNFSYLGVRGKPSFKILNICKVIIDAVRTHINWKNVTDAELDKIISNWLRHAKGRIQQKKTKHNVHM